MPETSLPEASVWHDTIHRAEDGDPVNGGVPDRATRSGGPNIAAKGLADRTRWLRDAVDGILAQLTPEELLALLRTVDGAGSGLDADTVDGLHASAFLLASRAGSGNGLDADTVDGKHADQLGLKPGQLLFTLFEQPSPGFLLLDGAEYLKLDYPELLSASGPHLWPGSTNDSFRAPGRPWRVHPHLLGLARRRRRPPPGQLAGPDDPRSRTPPRRLRYLPGQRERYRRPRRRKRREHIEPNGRRHQRADRRPENRPRNIALNLQIKY